MPETAGSPASPGIAAATGRPRAVEVSPTSLILACCLPGHVATVRPETPRGGWNALLDLARRHRVIALLATRLERAPQRDVVPPRVLREALEERARARALYAARGLVIGELLDALARDGVRAMLLKGQGIAERVYHDPTARLGNDIDLLVREDDQGAASRVLERLGYEPVTPERYREGHFHQPWRSRRRLAAGPVEIHWDVTEPDDVVKFDVASWWAGARTARFPFGEVLLPPSEEELAYVAFHAVQHGTTTVRDLLDVSRLAGLLTAEDDARRLREAARANGVSGFLAVAAWLVAELWGENELPRALADLPQPGRLARSLFDPRRLVREGPEESWSAMELARWSCLDAGRGGLLVPFRRAAARHARLAESGGRRHGPARDARLGLVLAASLARAAWRAVRIGPPFERTTARG